nr:LysM peptidoglycan-binding domain-containing protein [Anaerolineae bacterium]
MIRKGALVGILLAALVLRIVPASSLAAPQSWRLEQEGTNLLNNGDFETDWAAEQSHRCLVIPESGTPYETDIGNIFTPPGWKTWFRHIPGTWDQPEVRDAWKYVDPRRVYSGEKGMLLFTFYRRHDGGFFQQVKVEPGQRLRLTAWAHAWSNWHGGPHPDDPRWSEGPGYEAGFLLEGETPPADSPGTPDDWRNFTFYLGIDPTGGTNPYADTVVWGHGAHIYNEYAQPPSVEAVAEADTVTVFLRSKTLWPFKHNDAYWDNASLVVTGASPTPTSTPLPPSSTPTSTPTPAPSTPTNTPTPAPATPTNTPTPAPSTPTNTPTPPSATPTNTPTPASDTPTPAPSPTPRVTPTPYPEGAIVHVVRPGETLFRIALMYGVDLDQIRELNAGSIGPNDTIWPGQELVISLPGEIPTLTPVPASPTPEPSPVPVSPTSAASPTLESGSICVLAYHDRNGDGSRDKTTEELLPNAEFTVADASGVVDRYTSDGISEPYCFTGLAPGDYQVIQSPPPGYKPSGPIERPVVLAPGINLDLQFGNVLSESPAAADQTAEPTVVSGDIEVPTGGPTFSQVVRTAAAISGVLALVLAMVVAVLILLTRRRR